MSNIINLKSNASQPMVYQIKIRGYLCAQRSNWFGTMNIKPEENGKEKK